MSAIIGSLRAELSASIAKFQSDMGKAADSMDRFAKRARTVSRDIGRVGQELTIGLTAPILAFAVAAGKAAAGVQDAAGQVTAALTSMGNRSGKSLKELQKQAEDLRDTSLFDDDDILRDVTANMLTFGNIAGKSFDRAQQAAVNLATRLKKDLQSSTIQVGKALNDPIKGVTALQKVGVAFTQQQKDQIKTLVKTGQGYKAQGIILDELEKEFGGAAQASLDASPSGQILHAWDQLKEVFGAIVLKYLPPLTKFLVAVAERFDALPPAIQNLIVVLGGLIALLGPLALVVSTILKVGVVFADAFAEGGLLAGAGEALGALATALGGLAGAFLPLLAIIGAVVALVWQFRQVIIDAVMAVVKQVQAAFGQELPALLQAFGQLWADLTSGPVGEFFKVVGYLLAQFIAMLTTFLGGLAVKILVAFIRSLTAMVKVLDDMVRLVVALFSGDWAGAWKAAQAVVEDAVGGMLHALDAVLPGIQGWAQAVWGAVKQWVGDGVSAVLSWIEQRFPGLVSAMSAAAQGAVAWAKNLWAGIKTWINDNLGPVIQWAMDRLHDLAAFFGKVSAQANAATAPKPVDAPKPPAAPVAPRPVLPPQFNTGGGGKAGKSDAEKEAERIKKATETYAEAIRDLNDTVAKGLDEKELPKSVAAAEALRRKIADITDDAKRSGVSVANFAGQIGALKAQIDKLETEGLAKEADAFAKEVGADQRAVNEFQRGGLDPLADALQKVDDSYDALKARIQEHIDANAVLADKSAAAAETMKTLQGQLAALEAAHAKATEAAKAQYDAEKKIADLQAQAAMAETQNSITDLHNARGDNGIMSQQQEQMQAIERDLQKQRLDAATQLAELQAKYDEAHRLGDEDAMQRLAGQIGLQQELLTLVTDTTAKQIDATAKAKAAWQSFSDSLADSLSDMIVHWKFDLDGLRNIFADLAKELFLKPFLSTAAQGFSSFLQGFTGFHADGGTIRKGQWGIAGEHGPEPIFAKNSDLEVIPHGEATGAVAGGRGVTQVFNIGRMDQDTFRQTRRQFARTAKEALA